MRKENRFYYLAYGSNLNMGQMSWRCPEAEPIGTAEIEDYELLFKGSKTGAYLTIEKKRGSKVPVGVWEVSKRDITALNRYEGYPRFYYRKEIILPVRDFWTEEIRECSAFVYIMHEDRKLGIPTKSYVRTCLEGYQDFGFDAKYLQRALYETAQSK